MDRAFSLVLSLAVAVSAVMNRSVSFVIQLSRRSVVGYDGGLASEWLPVRTLPRALAVSFALRLCPCGLAIVAAILSSYKKKWLGNPQLDVCIAVVNRPVSFLCMCCAAMSRLPHSTTCTKQPQLH
jgi:hypothetical protein